MTALRYYAVYKIMISVKVKKIIKVWAFSIKGCSNVLTKSVYNINGI